MEIRKQWRNAACCFPGHEQAVLDTPFVKGEGTVDSTKRLQRFQELTLTGKSEDLAVALDEEQYPKVRSPFGCWCFIEESGGIEHNKYNENFTGFGANFATSFRGIRSDFFVPTLTLQTFLASATVHKLVIPKE